MKRAAARREELTDEAIESLVLQRYGPETRIADLHPDVRELFQLALLLNRTVIGGNGDEIAEVLAYICALIARYADQDLTDTPPAASMSSEPLPGHDIADANYKVTDVVGTPGDAE